MATQVLHLTYFENKPNDYSIQQGATFDLLTFVLEGNYTTWEPRGEIRDNYLAYGGDLKASFQFFPLVQGTLPVNGVVKTGTLVRPFLSAEQTSEMLWSGMTFRDSDRIKPYPGKNVWVYDIVIESPDGIVKRLVEGFVELSPGVTRDN